MMASDDPIYISSDEEEGSSKLSKLIKDRSPERRASKRKCRAKSLGLPMDQREGPIERSRSVPAAYTVQPSLIPRSTQSLKPERSLISAARFDDSAATTLFREASERYKSPFEAHPAEGPSQPPGQSAIVPSPEYPASKDDCMVGGGDVGQ